MSEELAWAIVVVAAVLVGIGLLLMAGLVYVIVRFRPRLLAIVAAVGAVLYGLSPIDAVPEAFVGPAGTLDDLAVWAVAGYAMYREVRRRLAEEAGPSGDASKSSSDPSTAGPPPSRDTTGPATTDRSSGRGRVVVGEVVDSASTPAGTPTRDS